MNKVRLISHDRPDTYTCWKSSKDEDGWNTSNSPITYKKTMHF